MLSNAGLAAEGDFCKALCSAEKRECRGAAQRLTVDDTNPVLQMGEENRLARDFGEVRVRSQEVRGSEMRNFRDRKMERNRVCDDTFMRCTNACSSQVPAAPSPGILRKPETNR